MNNKIIVFEGPDGSGKTTQCKILEQYLKAKNIKVFYFKSRVKSKKTYEVICEIENNNEKNFPKWLKACLIAYERSKQLYEFFNSVEDAFIIVDKYIYSTEIYLKYKKISPEYPEMILSWLPQPDLLFYFDLDANNCMNRIISRGGRIGANENYEFLSILGCELKEKISQKSPKIYIVDANKDIDTISDEIKNSFNECFLDI